MIVIGAVQGVGYRAHVKFYATQLGLKGLVRNLSDGQVEIFCEGPEEKTEKLVKHIDIKSETIDPSNPNVEHIETHRDGEDGYTPPWKTYDGFEIDYGDQTLTTLEKEALESSEYAKLQFWYLRNEAHMLRTDSNRNFNKMSEKQGSMTDEAQKLRADTNRNFNQMTEKQDSMTEEVRMLRTDTNKNFNQMAEKYGSISENLKSTNKEIKGTLKETKNGIQGAIEDLPEKLKAALIEGFKDILEDKK